MSEFLRSDAALRRFFCRLPDYALVMLDLDGEVAGWNGGAEALLGYSADDAVGTHFSVFYTPEDNAIGHPGRELAAAASIGRHDEEGWRVRQDGTLFWAHFVIIAIHDEAHRLCGFGAVLRDCTERKRATEQSANVVKLLEHTARTDYLTGLENRRSFDPALTKALSASRRHVRPLSLAMIDLDRFKKFNDDFGHQAGDNYLKLGSGIWRASLRPEDFIARYGGEEFVVLLPETALDGAIQSMERLRARTPPPLTCSVGLAQWDGIESPDGLIGRADQALYKAKELGRDQLIASPVPDEVRALFSIGEGLSRQLAPPEPIESV